MKKDNLIIRVLGRGFTPKFKSGDRIINKKNVTGFIWDVDIVWDVSDRCFHEAYKCVFDNDRTKIVVLSKYELANHNDGIVAQKGWQFGCGERISYGKSDGTNSWNEHHRPNGDYCSADKFVPYTGR